MTLTDTLTVAFPRDTLTGSPNPHGVPSAEPETTLTDTLTTLTRLDPHVSGGPCKGTPERVITLRGTR